MISFDIDRNWS